MRPCDCKDLQDMELLDHSSLAINNESIEVYPGIVILSIGPCTIKMSQRRFEQFARWYLEDQENEDQEDNESKTHQYQVVRISHNKAIWESEEFQFEPDTVTLPEGILEEETEYYWGKKKE